MEGTREWDLPGSQSIESQLCTQSLEHNGNSNKSDMYDINISTITIIIVNFSTIIIIIVNISTITIMIVNFSTITIIIAMIIVKEILIILIASFEGSSLVSNNANVSRPDVLHDSHHHRNKLL